MVSGNIGTEQHGFNPLWVFQCAATQKPPNLLNFLELVSIPYGFSNALRPVTEIVYVTVALGFNPLWVFQCAATCISLREGCRQRCFNPLWVFQCAATTTDRYQRDRNNSFQSLMGFPMRCDFISASMPTPVVQSFNPLWVFQCAATTSCMVWAYSCRFVSIPYGFSNALRLVISQSSPCKSDRFQSLMGFPMRCDYRKRKQHLTA